MYGPADLDEGNYATIGMMISRGAVLYKNIGDNKPPLFYYISALVSKVLGSNLLVIRLIFSTAIGVTSVFVYFAARKVYGNRPALISALLFTLFASSPIWGFYSPTNIYSSLMETIAIFLLIRGLIKERLEARYTILAGAFLGLAVLTRQTGGLVFAAVVLWYLIRFYRVESVDWRGMIKQTSTRLLWLCSGAVLMFLPVIVYFASTSALNDMIYWVLMEPVPGLAKYTPWSYELKIGWFVIALLPMAPLLVFTITTVRKDIRGKLEKTLLLVLWLLVPILFFLLVPLPSYVHYYYQILPPLCIMAGEGLMSFRRCRRQANVTTSRKGFKKLMPTRRGLIDAILVISVISSLISNIVLGYAYVSRYDVQVAMKVGDFIKNHTAPSEKIFVFEFWVKIGPLIYYLSERPPPVPRPFFFTYMPNGMTSLDVENVEKALLEEDVKYVVFIGPPPPPEWNASKLLLTILSNYYPFYVVCDKYVQFPASPAPPWVSELEVVVYKRLDLWSQEIKAIDVESNITIKYDFPSQGRWVTEVRSINEYRGWLTMPNAAMSFEILANEDNNTLYIDLFDAKGNFREFGLFLNFKGWKNITVPISDTFFPKQHVGSPNFDEIVSLHFLLEHTVRGQPYPKQPISGSLSGLVSIRNVQILYVDKTNVGD